MPIRLSKKHLASGAAATAAIAIAAYMLIGQAPSPQNCYFVTMPPRQYDHPPTRAFTDERVHHAVLDAACRSAADFSYLRMLLQSCVITAGDHVTRIIPDDLSPSYTKCLIEHENGHINGWGPDHPNARRYSAPMTS